MSAPRKNPFSASIEDQVRRCKEAEERQQQLEEDEWQRTEPLYAEAAEACRRQAVLDRVVESARDAADKERADAVREAQRLAAINTELDKKHRGLVEQSRRTEEGLLAKNAALDVQVRELMRELTRCEEENAEDADKSAANHKRFQQAIDAVRAENEELRAELQGRATQNVRSDLLEQEMEVIKTKMQDLTRANQALGARIQTANAESAAAQKETTRITEENLRIKREAERATRESAGHINQLTAQLAQVRGQMALDTDVAASKIRELEESNRALAAKVVGTATAAGRIAVLEAELAAVQAQLAAVGETLPEGEESLEKISAPGKQQQPGMAVQITPSKLGVVPGEDQLFACRKLLDDKEEEVRDLQDKIGLHKATIEQYKIRNAAIELALHQVKEENEDMVKRLAIMAVEKAAITAEEQGGSGFAAIGKVLGLEAKVSELNVQLLQAQQQLAAYQAPSAPQAPSSTELAALQAKLDKCETQRTLHYEQASASWNENQALTQELGTVRADILLQKAAVAERDQRLATLSAEHDQAKAALVLKHQEEMRGMEDGAASLRRLMEEAEAKAAALARDVAELTKQRNATRAEADEVIARVAALEANKETWLAERRGLFAEANALKATIASHEKQLPNMQALLAEHDAKNREIEGLKDQLAKLAETSNRLVKEAFAEGTADLEGAVTRVKAAEVELAALKKSAEAELAALKKSAAEQAAVIEELQKQLREAKNAQAGVVAELERAEDAAGAAARLRGELEAAKQELAEMRDLNQKATADNDHCAARLAAEIERFKTRAAELREQLDTCTAAKGKLEVGLQAMKAAKETLEKSLNQQGAETAQAGQAHMAQLQQLADQHQREIDALKESPDAAYREISAQLADVKQRFADHEKKTAAEKEQLQVALNATGINLRAQKAKNALDGETNRGALEQQARTLSELQAKCDKQTAETRAAEENARKASEEAERHKARAQACEELVGKQKPQIDKGTQLIAAQEARMKEMAQKHQEDRAKLMEAHRAELVRYGEEVGARDAAHAKEDQKLAAKTQAFMDDCERKVADLQAKLAAAGGGDPRTAACEKALQQQAARLEEAGAVDMTRQRRIQDLEGDIGQINAELKQARGDRVQTEAALRRTIAERERQIDDMRAEMTRLRDEVSATRAGAPQRSVDAPAGESAQALADLARDLAQARAEVATLEAENQALRRGETPGAGVPQRPAAAVDVEEALRECRRDLSHARQLLADTEAENEALKRPGVGVPRRPEAEEDVDTLDQQLKAARSTVSVTDLALRDCRARLTQAETENRALRQGAGIPRGGLAFSAGAIQAQQANMQVSAQLRDCEARHDDTKGQLEIVRRQLEWTQQEHARFVAALRQGAGAAQAVLARQVYVMRTQVQALFLALHAREMEVETFKLRMLGMADAAERAEKRDKELLARIEGQNVAVAGSIEGELEKLKQKEKA
jgi:chromosome segregation ATPase